MLSLLQSKTSNKISENTAQQTTSAPDHNYSKNDPNVQTNVANLQSQCDENNATVQADVERILDLVRWDAKSEVKCLVKYKGITKPQWVPVDEIRRTHPIPLINYYETRIVLRKKQYEMAFERSSSSPAQRKLVVIQ